MNEEVMGCELMVSSLDDMEKLVKDQFQKQVRIHCLKLMLEMGDIRMAMMQSQMLIERLKDPNFSINSDWAGKQIKIMAEWTAETLIDEMVNGADRTVQAMSDVGIKSTADINPQTLLAAMKDLMKMSRMSTSDYASIFRNHEPSEKDKEKER
jgi:hypothetical protein